VCACASACRSESRGVPLLLFLKKAWVEYYPMGVIGIIVPWVHTYHKYIYIYMFIYIVYIYIYSFGNSG
jgi:hypothetical protein